MKRQSDGFSLIEVIIATAILAVLVMSLLSYFSLAYRYANKGKSTQKADMAAQSITDELASCTTFEQIQDLPNKSAEWSIVSLPGAGKNVYTLSRDIAVDGTNYKARVKVDFDSYKKGVGGEPTATPVSKYNDYEVPQIAKVYSENNVVLEETDQTQSAIGSILHQVYKDNNSITKGTIIDGLKRKMYLTLEPYTAPGAAQPDYYMVKMNYEYSYTEAGKKYLSELPLKSVKIEKDSLKKIYLFYQPVNNALKEESLDIEAKNMPVGFSLTDFQYYAVLQKDAAITPPSDYHLGINSGGNVAPGDLKDKVYTNANVIDGKDNLIGYKKQDRIARVTVEIYHEDETEFNEENRIVKMETSKGA